MITSELISYIRKQIDNNISKDLIISNLVEAGWRMEDIEEAFLSIVSVPQEEPILRKIDDVVETVDMKRQKNVDQYREPIDIGNNNEIKKIEIIKAKTQDIDKLKNKSSTTDFFTPVISKVWVPTSVPVKENSRNIKEVSNEEHITKEVTIQRQELPAKNEEFIPTLIPKIIVNSFGSVDKNKKENPKKIEETTISVDEKSKEPLKNSLPKMAMLSSYQNDLLYANKTAEEGKKQKNHKIIKWSIFIFFILIIASAVWSITSGYVNIENINISFIKKDPKTLLLNNSKVLSSLKSYKSETNIEILSPSFPNIVSGLVGGEAINSLDKDSVLINAQGMINKNENSLSSNNFITIRSSLLQDDIVTDIKDNGLDIYVSVPDLSQIIKEDAPEPSIIKINKQQFNLIPSIFSFENELILNKINFYKILSSGMTSYINNETLGVYDEFINNTNIIEKDEETIKGVETYHYSVNTDRQLSKKLLNEITNNFVLNLSDEDSNKLDLILGSIIIDSFEVWVGKGDNNIYQYNIVLDIPLSKIIGFEDKSIGDNKIKINWKTTYYDFNISNNIIIPENSVPITDFINTLKKEKIKNDILSFKQLAMDLRNLEKSYGKNSNIKGSCMEPTPGSLFSPTGHIKNSTPAISAISLFLNKTLDKTNNVGYCYSTRNAWSFTIPIFSDYGSTVSPLEYESYFCIDSTGSAITITTPPTGVVCLPTAIPTDQ